MFCLLWPISTSIYTFRSGYTSSCGHVHQTPQNPVFTGLLFDISGCIIHTPSTSHLKHCSQDAFLTYFRCSELLQHLLLPVGSITCLRGPIYVMKEELTELSHPFQQASGSQGFSASRNSLSTSPKMADLSISCGSLGAIHTSFAAVSVGTPKDPLEVKLRAMFFADFQAVELGFPDLLSFASSHFKN